MNRKWLGLLFVCLVSLTALGFGSSQPVILGNSDPGQIQFTNSGSDSANMSFTGDLSGFAYYGATVGSYSMTMIGGRSGPPTLGAPTDGIYPLNMNGNMIDFSSTFGSYFLDGTVDLINVTDGTNTPRFIGGLDITSSNIPGFADGAVAPLDFNIYLGRNPTIDQVYSGEAHSTEGPIASGELQPVPEPSSIALFGSGALGLAGMLRRKLSR
jgi:PEP-CTERM motif